MSWELLISLRHSSVISRSSYGLFLVPFIAAALSYIQNHQNLLPPWTASLRLPLNMTILYFSAFFATCGHIIVTLRCPGIIQEVRTSFAYSHRKIEEVELILRLRRMKLLWQRRMQEDMRNRIANTDGGQLGHNVDEEIERILTAAIKEIDGIAENDANQDNSLDQRVANAFYSFKNWNEVNQCLPVARWFATTLYVVAFLMGGYALFIDPAIRVASYFISYYL